MYRNRPEPFSRLAQRPKNCPKIDSWRFNSTDILLFKSYYMNLFQAFWNFFGLVWQQECAFCNKTTTEFLIAVSLSRIRVRSVCAEKKLMFSNCNFIFPPSHFALLCMTHTWICMPELHGISKTALMSLYMSCLLQRYIRCQSQTFLTTCCIRTNVAFIARESRESSTLKWRWQLFSFISQALH